MAQLATFFSCGASEPKTPTFDGEKAFQYLIEQCDFGPRVPGSQAHKDCLYFLTTELRKFGATVTPQPFRQKLPGFENRLTVKPGLTGLAQIKNGYDTDMDSIRRKLEYDLQYIRNMSLGMELRLLAATLTKFHDSGAR